MTGINQPFFNFGGNTLSSQQNQVPQQDATSSFNFYYPPPPPPPPPPFYNFFPFFDQLRQLIHQLNIQQMSSQFDQLDVNQNGVLEEQEIGNFSMTAQILSRDEHELMFANIDPGNAAWHGLSRADLSAIQSNLRQGGRLEDLGDQLRQEIAAERGAPADDAGFEQWVEERRAQIPNPGEPEPPSVSDDLATIQANFAQYDLNGNGVLEASEINQETPIGIIQPGGPELGDTFDALVEHNRELMFANIDPGNAAWHGLTQQDLATLQTRVDNGETLDQISDSLRQEISAQRGAPADEAGFRQWVDQRRDSIPNPGSEPGNPSVSDQIEILQNGFTEHDVNQNGILEASELTAQFDAIYAVVPEGIQQLAEYNRELMFANIDPGNAAWHGYSQQDLATIQTRLANGETLEQIAEDLQQRISTQRGAPADDAGFRQWVDEMRTRFSI